jgi:hypothetical protein
MTKRIKLPLLHVRSKSPDYPNKRKPVCPVCGESITKSGTAWLKFETIFCDADGKETHVEFPDGAHQRSIMHIISHGNENCDSQLRKYGEWGGQLLHSPKPRKRSGESYKTRYVIDNLKFNRVTIKFCSIKCMKKFFNDIFDDFVEDFRSEYGYDP